MAEDQNNWYYECVFSFGWWHITHCALKMNPFYLPGSIFSFYTKLPMYLSTNHKATNIVTDSLISELTTPHPAPPANPTEHRATIRDFKALLASETTTSIVTASPWSSTMTITKSCLKAKRTVRTRYHKYESRCESRSVRGSILI
jgi:hypothetical protein